MRRIVLPLLAIVCAFVPALPISAQKVLPKSIQFQGDPEYSHDELMTAAGLKSGDILAVDDMNGAGKKLMATGVFDQLNYKFDGQDLIFTITPASDLLLVRIDNLPIVPGPALDAELRRRFPLYHGKVPSQGTLLDDVRGAFKQMLAAEGIKADVTAIPYGERKIHNKVTAMNFAIAAPPVLLGAIQFQGASPALLPRLQAIARRMSDRLFDSNGTSAALVDRFTSFYQDLGYAAVRVNVTQTGNPVVGANAIQVPQLITVNEGEIYKISSVTMPADCLVSQDEADKIIAAANDGPLGSNFRNLLERIDRQYKSKGYLDLVVTPHPEFDEAAASVKYSIEIIPGAIYHVAYVKFENVSDDLRSHLMRAWQLLPGDPMDMTYLDMYMKNAMDHDPVLKRSLASALVRFETSADPNTRDVDIVVRMEK